MTFTAAQVREACSLLRWRSSKLARDARIGFDKAQKARDEVGIAGLNWLDLLAVRDALERNGVEFGTDGWVRLRKAGA